MIKISINIKQRKTDKKYILYVDGIGVGQANTKEGLMELKKTIQKSKIAKKVVRGIFKLPILKAKKGRPRKIKG